MLTGRSGRDGLAPDLDEKLKKLHHHESSFLLITAPFISRDKGHSLLDLVFRGPVDDQEVQDILDGMLSASTVLEAGPDEEKKT